jgi:hypothetical protein
MPKDAVLEREERARKEMDKLLYEGHKLARSDEWKPWVEGLSESKAAVMAMLLRNQDRYEKGGELNETTRTAAFGYLDKFTFPIVRAVMPSLIANEIASMQPMTGPTGQCFYMDFIRGDNKGSSTAGSTSFDSRSGPAQSEFYSSEIIDAEATARTSGSANADAYVTKLAYTPVRPGSVSITYTETSTSTARTVTDDGNGNLIGTGSSGTINYNTGAISLSATTNDVTDTSVRATYRYVMEGSDQIASLDIALTPAPIFARPYKLRARFTLEAAQNAQAQFGIDVQSEMVAAASEQMKFDFDNKVIGDLWQFAGAGNVQWDASTPPGVSWNDHKLSLVDAFVRADTLVFDATKRMGTNWAVCGTKVCNVIQTLPSFAKLPGATGPSDTGGTRKIGVLADQWTIYKSPYLPKDKWLQGWKGDGWTNTGYVVGMYIPLYVTPQLILDDFVSRQGIGMMLATKSINSKFYVTGQALNV